MLPWINTITTFSDSLIYSQGQHCKYQQSSRQKARCPQTFTLCAEMFTLHIKVSKHSCINATLRLNHVILNQRASGHSKCDGHVAVFELMPCTWLSLQQSHKRHKISIFTISINTHWLFIIYFAWLLLYPLHKIQGKSPPCSFPVCSHHRSELLLFTRYKCTYTILSIHKTHTPFTLSTIHAFIFYIQGDF